MKTNLIGATEALEHYIKICEADVNFLQRRNCFEYAKSLVARVNISSFHIDAIDLIYMMD